MRKCLVPVLASLLLVACAGAKPAPEAAPPSISKQRVEIDERNQTLSGLQALTRIVLKNEGQTAATATRASYEVVMDGKVVAKGELPLTAAIAPAAEATVELPVPVVYAADAEQLAALAESKKPIDFAIRGVIEVGGASVEFARASAVRAPRLPRVKLANLETIKTGGQALSINASLSIDNPNPFPLEVMSLRWKLAVADKAAGEGAVARNATLKPASQTTYELVLMLEPGDLKAREIALDAAELPYSVTGALELDGLTIDLDESGSSRLLRDGE